MTRPWLLLALGVTALRIPLAAWIPLTPEEAYHWNFGKHPDWSYLDHPPMIAWSIGLGCELFGDTPLGVRFVPLLFSLGTIVILARLAARMFSPSAALPAVLLFCLLPLAFGVSGAGFPDSPLLFFWTLGMSLGWEAFRTGRPGFWLSAGAALGAAMLSKYTAVFLTVSWLAFALSTPDRRRRLASPWPWLGVALALVVFSPVLYWNAGHEWASLRYQSVGRLSQANELSLVSPLKFLAQQLVGTLGLAAPLGVAVLWGCRGDRRPEVRYLLACFVPLFGFFLLVSFGRSTHLLWPLPAFASVVMLMAAAVAEAGNRTALFYAKRASAIASVAGVLLVLGGLHAAVFLPGLSPFQGLHGWDRVAERARHLRSRAGADPFWLGLGRKYTVPSQLAFHLRAPTEVHGKNVLGLLGLQYDYWTDRETLRGRDAVVVIDARNRESEYRSLLESRFRALEEAGSLVIPVGRDPFLDVEPLRFVFYIARDYRPEPSMGRSP
jgi:dolichol-phosphate mannosyltransferase